MSTTTVEEQAGTAAPTPARIGVLIGSTRPARAGRRIAEEIAAVAAQHFTGEIDLIDLTEVPLPWLSEPQLPARGSYVHEHTQRWGARIGALDGVIILTPQYNGGYPGPLKNAIDTLYAEWNDLPILVVSYGFHGGSLAAEQLTQVLGVVKAHAVEPRVALTYGSDDLDDQGRLIDAAAFVARHGGELSTGITHLVSQLRVAAG